ATAAGFPLPSRRSSDLKELVSLLDMPPTLLDAAGIAVPDAMQGRSVLDLFRKDSAPWPEEVLVQISEQSVSRAIRTDRYKYSVRSEEHTSELQSRENLV